MYIYIYFQFSIASCPKRNIGIERNAKTFHYMIALEWGPKRNWQLYWQWREEKERKIERERGEGRGERNVAFYDEGIFVCCLWCRRCFRSSILELVAFFHVLITKLEILIGKN